MKSMRKGDGAVKKEPSTPTPQGFRISRITNVRRTLHKYLRKHFTTTASLCPDLGGGALPTAGRVAVDHVALVDFDVFGFDTAGLLRTLKRLDW